MSDNRNIHERTLAVERRTVPVLGDDNPLNRREIELAEGVVLGLKQTSPPSIGFSRIDSTIHDPPAHECLRSLRPFPSMKEQSVHVVRPFVDGKPGQRHEESSCSAWIIRARRRYF
jgi:hypothetical protein